MNKKIMLGVGALVMALTVGLAACNGGNGGNGGGGGGNQLEDARLPRTPNFGSGAAVHDPSVFKDDDGTYYAFGSHFAVAKSDDLITWSQVQGDCQNNPAGNKLFGGKINEVLADTIAALNVQGNLDAWAPDVVKHGNKYYMYYSVSTFATNRSLIGRVEATNVTGPYSNNTILLKTGNSGEPNAIDPNIFTDKDGKMWMIYGSHFTGIYTIELETSGDKFGLPKYEGIGDHLWASWKEVVEGPYMFYNPDTEYYYLMTSYGSLSSNYNMRVVRSKTPDGGFEDILGQTPASTANEYVGNKLAGNYQFAGDGAHVAMGHNSVLVEDGKYLVVTHVRDRVDGMHHLEVHQLFFNEEGWPVLSPNRYAGETLGKIKAENVIGNYDLILHSEGVSADIVSSEKYTFMKDGTVMKGADEAGTWELTGDYYITVTLGDDEYKGVVAPSYIEYNGAAGYTITATLDDGNALWANPVKG